MANTEPKRIRDYKRENKLRKEKKRRLLVDIDLNKAEAFLKRLNDNNVSLTSWVNKQIDKELNA